jgi:hypothetical protein
MILLVADMFGFAVTGSIEAFVILSAWVLESHQAFKQRVVNNGT